MWWQQPDFRLPRGNAVQLAHQLEQFLEEAGQLIHDRCCQQLMELPYDYGRTIPTDDE